MFRDAVEPDDFASSMILSECERRQLLQVEVGSYNGKKSVAIHLDGEKMWKGRKCGCFNQISTIARFTTARLSFEDMVIKLGGMLPVTTCQADLLQRVVRYLGNMSALGWWGMPWKVHHSCVRMHTHHCSTCQTIWRQFSSAMTELAKISAVVSERFFSESLPNC